MENIMATKKPAAKKTFVKLLTTKEMTACKKIASQKASLNTKRAKVLLAIDEGLSSPQASKQMRLTLGQVKYLLSRFRDKRMAMFEVEVKKPAPKTAPKRKSAPPKTTAKATKTVKETKAKPKPAIKTEKKKKKDKKKKKSKKKSKKK